MKKTLLLFSVIVVTAITVISTLNTSNANGMAPPNSTAGAPSDAAGATCTGCHGGTATQTTGIISSDIPASGFIGGTTYNFTVTMSGSAAYGFEMTPQTATSNVGLGTWIAGTGSSVSGKYIKQTAKKTGASATWAFQWTAPATATTVTFYGAFNYANNNNTLTGDVIKTSSVTYLANSTGIEDNSISKSLISVFPNPAASVLHIASPSVFEKGFIYSINGSLVKTITEMELINKTIDIADLSNGSYFMTLSTNNKTSTSKFIKN